MLATVKRDESGRVAMLRQTLKMDEESGAVDGDNNGFVNIPLAAKEVLAVVYMREVRPDTYPCQPALERATSMLPRSPRNSAAAGIRMRPAAG